MCLLIVFIYYLLLFYLFIIFIYTIYYYSENNLTLHLAISHMSHVVTRFNGEGAVFVRCMLRINLDRPYFHSISDWA